MGQHDKLKSLVSGILTRSGILTEARLTIFLFFIEIQHYNEFGSSITGCTILKDDGRPYIVGLKESLDEGSGILWFREVMTMPVKYLDGAGKKQFLYEPLVDVELVGNVQKVVCTILEYLSGKSCMELTELVSSLSAWERYDVNMQIELSELAESFDDICFSDNSSKCDVNIVCDSNYGT